MKKFGKILCIILALSVILVTACSCEISSIDDETPPETSAESDAANEQSPESSDALTATRPEAAPLEPAGDLGKYRVEIGECAITEDYNGKPAAIISYMFTNNGDEATSAMVALSEKAFQNGVSLESAFFMDDSVVNSSDSMKDIQPGSSIEIKQGYLLSSESAPIEFEVEELISFDDNKLGKTFIIDEAGKTEYSVAPQGGVSGRLGDYEVSILSSEIGEDYDGKDVIIVHLPKRSRARARILCRQQRRFSAIYQAGRGTRSSLGI